MKHTKEVLEPLVRESLSVAEVVRKLGYKCVNGGTHAHVSKRLRDFGIDTSHFMGQLRAIGKNATPRRLNWEIVLVSGRKRNKEHTPVLRRAMIESGIKHECGTCGSGPEWNGKLLVLQISHKDGDSLNNERSNLQFECPNCHSQTEDYGGKSAGKKSFKVVDSRQDGYRTSKAALESSNLSDDSNIRPTSCN